MNVKNRIEAVVLEAEGVLHTCPDCNTPLEEVELPAAGMGDNARFPMLYCPTCDDYFTHWINYARREK